MCGADENCVCSRNCGVHDFGVIGNGRFSCDGCRGIGVSRVRVGRGGCNLSKVRYKVLIFYGAGEPTVTVDVPAVATVAH